MAERRAILHFITPLTNVSPFDVNMAVDAGFDVVMPYTQVTTGDVAGLVQDAIFSRAPQDGRHTAVLIGGREVGPALDMLGAARKALVPPHFQISLMADPSGGFTTAAAMIAVVEKALASRGASLDGCKVRVFGGKGPVGSIAGAIAAKLGADVALVGHRDIAGTETVAKELSARLGVTLRCVDGGSEEKADAILAEAEVILAAARAGQQVLSKAQLARATHLQVALDVNAVPPAGLEGIDAFAKGVAIEGTSAVGFGALAAGNVKFRTEHELLASMRGAEPRKLIGIDEAFAVARTHASKG